MQSSKNCCGALLTHKAAGDIAADHVFKEVAQVIQPPHSRHAEPKPSRRMRGQESGRSVVVRNLARTCRRNHAPTESRPADHVAEGRLCKHTGVPARASRSQGPVVASCALLRIVNLLLQLRRAVVLLRHDAGRGQVHARNAVSHRHEVALPEAGHLLVPCPAAVACSGAWTIAKAH